MKKLSAKQIEMLESFADSNEASDLADFNYSLGWHNRERVITSLHNRGLLDPDGLTIDGANALLKVWDRHISDHALRVIANAKFWLDKRGAT